MALKESVIRDASWVTRLPAPIMRQNLRLQSYRESSPSLRHWFNNAEVPKTRALRHEEWIAERLRHATIMLRESVEIDPEIRGGVPVVKGTRIPVALILAEIADDASISEIADDFEQDSDTLRKLLEGMAMCLDRPFFK